VSVQGSEGMIVMKQKIAAFWATSALCSTSLGIWKSENKFPWHQHGSHFINSNGYTAL